MPRDAPADSYLKAIRLRPLPLFELALTTAAMAFGVALWLRLESCVAREATRVIKDLRGS